MKHSMIKKTGYLLIAVLFLFIMKIIKMKQISSGTSKYSRKNFITLPQREIQQVIL